MSNAPEEERERIMSIATSPDFQKSIRKEKDEAVNVENLKKLIVREVSAQQANYELRSNSAVVRYTVDYILKKYKLVKVNHDK